MKIFSRLPLYLGLGVLVLAVLVSSKTISDKRSLSNTPRASSSPSALTLQKQEEGKVTVLVTSEKEIVGVDVVVKYDPAKVKVLPSTLRGTDSFITSGGVAEEAEGIFSFSAIVKEGESLKSGLVASFETENLGGGTTSDLELLYGEEKSAVILK